MTAQSAESVLRFWIGDLDSFVAGYPPDLDARRRLWFGGGEDIDSEIRARFAATLEAAAAGALDDWAQNPRSALALIIALDQFPRNIHRNTADAFDCDARALEAAESALDRGWDSRLPIGARSFFYMPLMHSEDAWRQERCVALFQKLRDDAPPSHREGAQESLGHAIAHRDIVARFGRFPHRNAVLGRESTAAEENYLRGGGRRFGQGGEN